MLNTPFGATPLTDFPLPIPSLSSIIPDLNITHWIPQGIHTVDDLQIEPANKTFRSTQIEYGIHTHDYFKYMQVSHFLKNNA